MTTTTAELDALAAAAAAAAPVWRASPAAERAAWLRAAADALDAHIDELVAIADEETPLGETRLRGEVGRTSGQLRLFATVVEEGSYLELTVDDADRPRPRRAPSCAARSPASGRSRCSRRRTSRSRSRSPAATPPRRSPRATP